MKRLLLIAVWIITVAGGLLSLGAVAGGPAVTVYLDGKLLRLDPPAVISGGGVLVPLRGVLEPMGATFKWLPAEKRVEIRHSSRLITLTVGRREAWLDDRRVTMDVAPRIIAHRVYIPLRFVAEALGAGLEWDPIRRQARVTSARIEVREEPQVLPVRDPGPGSYDVIVVGGEPEGVAAAVAAARAGARVLLVEKRDGLGGLMTYGMLNSIDMNYGPQGELLTRGVFSEFLAAVGGDSFDVQEARRVFTRLVQSEPNISMLFNAEFTEGVLNAAGDAITGVRVRHQGQLKTYQAPRVIDATQDADVAAAVGVPFTIGAADRRIQETMSSTLVFHLGGVQWNTIVKTLHEDDDRWTGANRVSAWGFWPKMSGYQSRSPRLRIRGLNIGKQKDGSILINALQIFGVNGLDPASRAEAMAVARAEMPYIVEFLRANIPGFAGAYLIGTAPELYVRETRHVLGEYVLNINDVLENRDFSDRIAEGAYPVDIQSTGPKDWGVVVGKPVQYSIPYRSLVPLNIDNLLVVGRAASFTSLAAGTARVIPVGMATGQAAGVAAAYSLRRGMTPRALSASPEAIREVQGLLVRQGAYLEPFTIANPLADHWAYPYLRVLRPLAVVAGGYDNNWRLDEVITAESFAFLLLGASERKAPGTIDQNGLRRMITKEPLQMRTALRMLLELRGVGAAAAPGDERELSTYLMDRGWLRAATWAHWDGIGPLTRGLAYALAVDTLADMGVMAE